MNFVVVEWIFVGKIDFYMVTSSIYALNSQFVWSDNLKFIDK